MFSSNLFLCLPGLLPLFTVPCKMVLARPDERETWSYHCSLRLFTMVRRSSCGPIACWILARTSWLVTWSLYGLCMRCLVSCGSTSFPWLVFFFGGHALTQFFFLNIENSRTSGTLRDRPNDNEYMLMTTWMTTSLYQTNDLCPHSPDEVHLPDRPDLHLRLHGSDGDLYGRCFRGPGCPVHHWTSRYRSPGPLWNGPQGEFFSSHLTAYSPLTVYLRIRPTST